MTRDEHLAWAKQRALAHCNAGDTKEAFASMVSDLKKHKELESHPAIELGFVLLLIGSIKSIPEMRKFIEGFN